MGLFLFRTGVPYYRSLRAAYNSRKPSIRKPPPGVTLALDVLFIFAILALLYTLPYVSPENVFDITRTRLQTSNEVIFTRLAAKRPLTDFDQTLKPKLTSNAARLVYFAYGPEPVARCNFCTTADPMSYLYYALPSLATPHLLHLFVLGLATSSLLSGAEGSRWRAQAILGGLALAGADLYFHLSYDMNANAASTNVNDIDFFFWRMRILRGVGIALLDGSIGWVMYLSSTNRFFLLPPSAAQRIGNVSNALDASFFRLWALGNARNAILRDEGLRGDMSRYWQEEQGVYEQREVVAAIRDALRQTDMQKLGQRAEDSSTAIVHALGPVV